MTELSRFLNSPWALMLLGALLSLVAGLLAGRFFEQRMPIAYSVAVIGLPRSGKTTLITAMFGEMFARRIMGYSVLPRGQSTIERVNSDLERLEIGKSLGPTTDQDLFAYRADIIQPRALLARTYKVEIGDFPGEDSASFAEQFGDWFHQTPYFKWAMEADAFIFVVDLACVLDKHGSRQYVARISRAIRAAWQRIQENHLQGKSSLHRKPVALVFMKADLLITAADGSPAFDQQAARYGAEEIEVPRLEVEPKALQPGRQHVTALFGELIVYFESQGNRPAVIFASAYAFDRGRRLGIDELLRAILPRREHSFPLLSLASDFAKKTSHD